MKRDRPVTSGSMIDAGGTRLTSPLACLRNRERDRCFDERGVQEIPHLLALAKTVTHVLKTSSRQPVRPTGRHTRDLSLILVASDFQDARGDTRS
jgi:hypothetical protein